MWAAEFRRPSFFPDFVTFYAEGRLVVDRGAAAAYDLGLQRQFQATLTSSWSSHGVFLPYLHPPYFTLLLAPLGQLGYTAAYGAWAVLDLILLGAALAIIVQAGGFDRVQAATVALFTVGFTPVYVALVEGQSDMVVLLPLAGSYWAWRRDRQALAGVMAGLAMVKPNLLLLLPLLFAARRSWPALAGLAGTAAFLGAICLVAFGPRPLLGYARLVTGWGIHGGPGFPISYQAALSVRGPLDAILGDTGSVGGLAVLAAAFVVMIARSRPDAPLDFALAVAGSVALSPYQNLHDLSLLLIPAAVVVEKAPWLQLAVLALIFTAIEAIRFFGPWSAWVGVLALVSLLSWERLRRPATKVPMDVAFTGISIGWWTRIWL